MQQHLPKYADAAKQLLLDSGVSTNKDVYDLNDAIKIQELLNHRYAEDEIRLVIFSSEHNKRIVWKGWANKPALYNLCLYLGAGHFSFAPTFLQCSQYLISKNNYYSFRIREDIVLIAKSISEGSFILWGVWHRVNVVSGMNTIKYSFK